MMACLKDDSCVWSRRITPPFIIPFAASSPPPLPVPSPSVLRQSRSIISSTVSSSPQVSQMFHPFGLFFSFVYILTNVSNVCFLA